MEKFGQPQKKPREEMEKEEEKMDNQEEKQTEREMEEPAENRIAVAEEILGELDQPSLNMEKLNNVAHNIAQHPERIHVVKFDGRPANLDLVLMTKGNMQTLLSIVRRRTEEGEKKRREDAKLATKKE